MGYRTTDPAGAKELLDSSEPWAYVDVRTEEEFAAGHVPGAYNVPIFLRDATGRMAPNTAFLEVIRRNFAADAKLVLGCAMGGRSMRACELLASEGYTDLINMHGGYDGYREPTGEVSEPGWAACGFATEVEADPARVYSALAG